MRKSIIVVIAIAFLGFLAKGWSQSPTPSGTTGVPTMVPRVFGQLGAAPMMAFDIPKSERRYAAEERSARGRPATSRGRHG